MTEILAPYRVGNIIYVDFDRAPARMRPRSKMPVSDDGNALWQASESAYLKAVNTPEQFTSESRAALVLALAKLLEVETDGDRCELLALRLATIQMQLAVMACSEKPDARQVLAGQVLEQLQSILDYVGDGAHVIEDGDQLVVAPTAVYMRMAAAHRLLQDERRAFMSLELAESSLERLDFKGSDWVKGKLLVQIENCRNPS
jgi:hypothetical protein